MFNRIIFIATFLSLSACSAPDVKPEDANLLEAAVNISSGEFDSQLSRKQFKLKNSQDALNAEADKNQKLNTQLQSLTVQKKAFDQQLDVLQAENRRLTQQANQTKALNSLQKAERKQQVNKIKRLNSSISTLKRKRVSAGGNKEYKAKITALQQEINVLRKMISNQ
ncbi:MAG: hypothetical protein L3J51_05065 [Cocleimonas sp.]|nr:hypothetical protein [Cocleimonas sp.]